jgi:hypothetical protein
MFGRTRPAATQSNTPSPVVGSASMSTKRLGHWFLLSCALLLASGSGCADPETSDEANTGVTGEAAAELCQMYCSECDGTLFTIPGAEPPTFDTCLYWCRGELAGICGSRVEANLYCEMGIRLPVGQVAPECTNRRAIEAFCSEYRRDHFDCLEEVWAACEVVDSDGVCGPGTALHDGCTPGNPNYMGEEDCEEHISACIYSRGDCDADWVVERCEDSIRIGFTDCSIEECISLFSQAREDDTSFTFPPSCTSNDG